MFQSDHSPDLPADSDLLADLGIDPSTVREIAEDDRAIRCPERPAAYPERSFTRLVPEPAVGGLGEAAPAEPWDPGSPLPPVD